MSICLPSTPNRKHLFKKIIISLEENQILLFHSPPKILQNYAWTLSLPFSTNDIQYKYKFLCILWHVLRTLFFFNCNFIYAFWKTLTSGSCTRNLFRFFKFWYNKIAVVWGSRNLYHCQIKCWVLLKLKVAAHFSIRSDSGTRMDRNQEEESFRFVYCVKTTRLVTRLIGEMLPH